MSKGLSFGGFFWFLLCFFFVNYFAHSVTNVSFAIICHRVRDRLQTFWKTWASLGLSPWVVSNEDHTLAFRMGSPFTRQLLIKSGYSSLLWNSYLLEALHSHFTEASNGNQSPIFSRFLQLVVPCTQSTHL